MRYNIHIDQKKCLEYGLNEKDGALIDLLNQLGSWANHAEIDGDLFYNITIPKIINELPLFFNSRFTVNRSYNRLKEKGLILQKKLGPTKKNYVRLTKLGATWNTTENIEDLPGKKCSSKSALTDSVRANLHQRESKSALTLKTVNTSDYQEFIKSVRANLHMNNNIITTSNKSAVNFLLKSFKKELGLDVAKYFDQNEKDQQQKVLNFIDNLEDQKYIRFLESFKYYRLFKDLSKQHKHSWQGFMYNYHNDDWQAKYYAFKKLNTEPEQPYRKDAGVNKKLNIN